MATARDELFAKADTLGLKYKKNWSADDMMVLIEEAEMAKIENKIDGNVVVEKSKVDNSKINKASNQAQNIVQKIVKTKGQSIRDSKKLIRCIITPLDETMRSVNSEMYSIGTASTGFVKKVILFNKETLEPMSVIRNLLGRKLLMQTDSATTGKVKLESPDAFSIKILPDYTETELKKLFEKGRANRGKN